MQLKHEEESQPNQVVATVGEQPQQQHGDEHRRLHEHPTQLVVDGRTPFRVVELAVARINEEEAHEHHHSHHGHDDQEHMKRLYRHFR